MFASSHVRNSSHCLGKWQVWELEENVFIQSNRVELGLSTCAFALAWYA